MTPLTRRDVLTHQTSVPWPTLRQVEQDLLLCRAMAAIFNDPFLPSQVAMRGGTLLHKVYLPPASRYSEDLDLVVIGDRPENHIRLALRRVMEEVLGNPQKSVWEAVTLAIRNAVRPSRVLRMNYSVPSVSELGPALDVVVEANVTERTPHLPMSQVPFEFSFRGSSVKTLINGYDIHEMLGTKMRALFQRSRGRDLFDLYWALTTSNPPVDPAAVIAAFQYYLQREGGAAGRTEFVNILEDRLADAGFCSDMEQLLRTGIVYDPQSAGDHLREELLRLLPE